MLELNSSRGFALTSRRVKKVVTSSHCERQPHSRMSELSAATLERSSADAHLEGHQVGGSLQMHQGFFKGVVAMQ